MTGELLRFFARRLLGDEVMCVVTAVVAFELGSVVALVAGGVSEATVAGPAEVGNAIEGPGSALLPPLFTLMTMPTIAATATTATMPMIGPALLFFGAGGEAIITWPPPVGTEPAAAPEPGTALGDESTIVRPAGAPGGPPGKKRLADLSLAGAISRIQVSRPSRGSRSRAGSSTRAAPSRASTCEPRRA